MTMQNEPPNLFYRGSSMKGTFKPGDRLAIEKVSFNQIHKGDLIVFRKSIKDEIEFVVHRVEAVLPDGLVTRGDHCRLKDNKSVNEEDIIGRVIYYDRDGILFDAHNGYLGQLRSFLLHVKLHLTRLLKLLFRKPYRKLRESNLVSRVWKPHIRCIYLRSPEGPFMKFIHGDRTVATYWFKGKYWFGSRVYDLILRTGLQELLETISNKDFI